MLASEESPCHPAHVFALDRRQAIGETECRAPIAESGGGPGQLERQAQVRCQPPDLTCLKVIPNSL